MVLRDRLREISKEHKLDKNLKLKVTCFTKSAFTGTNVTIGQYAGYVQAIDNTPEIAELDLITPEYPTGITVIMEPDIEKIEVVE